MPRRVCQVTGKACYGGVHDARLAHRSVGHRLRVYRCEACGAMHVGNGDKWEREQGRRHFNGKGGRNGQRESKRPA